MVRGREPKPTRRRERRAPKAKRTAADILADPPKDGAQGPLFKDPDMERLRKKGYIDEFMRLVKGGKEATVYLVKRGQERLAAKVYADIQSRSFRKDGAYWSGVHIADQRVERALRQRSRRGRAAQQAIWVMREYANLWRLTEAGLSVPRPAVGPAVTECAEAGSVVLMEFIGDGDAPAPRLSDVRFGSDERERAEKALSQSVAILLGLADLGLVHGDYSTYNLLWHDGRV